MRTALDSDVLVYAALEPGSEKGRRAAEIIRRAAIDGVLAAQAVLEFVAVVRRRAPFLADQAITQAIAWAAVFEIAPTSPLVMAEAFSLMRDHRFQVWDGVIWSASRAAGARLLLTEDLQDGLVLNGLRALNPFTLTGDAFGRLFAG